MPGSEGGLGPRPTEVRLESVDFQSFDVVDGEPGELPDHIVLD